ncbi:MAG TPA: TIGR02444 family protein [Steroidobacteraceae bacterium]|nr:TIGR02444 family protein [Steroidobacteraceae bacterium]
MLEGSPPRTSLWDFSVSLYGKPGVAQECLSLQERFGVDVMLLLLAAYGGAELGALLSSEDLAEADRLVAQWRGNVVRRLRGLRQFLKASPDAPTQALRAKVKEAELDSERIEAAILERWLDSRVSALTRSTRAAAVAHNIQSVLAFYGAAGVALRHLYDC